MLDQYDKPIPDDLVLLPNINLLSDHNVRLVANAVWYDVEVDLEPDSKENGECIILCASAEAIDYLSEDSPCGKVVGILRVNDVLKRWSPEDGFYHA